MLDARYQEKTDSSPEGIVLSSSAKNVSICFSPKEWDDFTRTYNLCTRSNNTRRPTLKDFEHFIVSIAPDGNVTFTPKSDKCSLHINKTVTLASIYRVERSRRQAAGE